jgi:polysaccharide biosynthesis protein PslH
LEAMASGTPVVTTPLGIEGLGATHEKEVLVGNTAHELARLSAKVLEDEMLYKNIAKNARVFIETYYTWDTIVDRLEKVYKTVVPL